MGTSQTQSAASRVSAYDLQQTRQRLAKEGIDFLPTAEKLVRGRDFSEFNKDVRKAVAMLQQEISTQRRLQQLRISAANEMKDVNGNENGLKSQHKLADVVQAWVNQAQVEIDAARFPNAQKVLKIDLADKSDIALSDLISALVENGRAKVYGDSSTAQAFLTEARSLADTAASVNKKVPKEVATALEKTEKRLRYKVQGNQSTEVSDSLF